MSTPDIPGATVTSRRGRKPGQQPKERKTIPAAEFVMEDIAEESRGFLRRQRLERSAQQQAVDQKVMSVWQEWDVNKPAKWPAMPVKGWVISTDFEEDALFMLGKAAGLHDKKLVVGKIQRKPLPNLPLPEGKVRIPFCVVTRKVKVEEMPEGSETTE